MINTLLKNKTDFHITSDTWFGRPNIIEIANRFSLRNVEEMNSHLIKNWNKSLKKDDVIIHLGNFAWDPKTARDTLRKLNGQIIFLLGNADNALLEVYKEFKNVTVLSDQIVELLEFNTVLCHYPLDVWNGKTSNVIHIHGHTIFSHKTDLSSSYRINACIDFWNYSPIKYSLIKDFINAKENL